MARALDAAELLGVDVQQVAGRLVLVAHDRLGRLQIAQLGQPGTREHAPDGALGHAQARGDARMGQALAAQLDDRQRLGRIDARGLTRRSGGAIATAPPPLRQVAAKPLARRRRAHAMRRRGGTRRLFPLLSSARPSRVDGRK